MNEQQERFYRMYQKVFRPIYDITIDCSIVGPHNVPDDGPFVLVANHRSDLDPFLLIVNVRRPINFLGASYLWNIPGGKWFMNNMGGIPVSKYKNDVSRAFAKAAAVLELGQGVGIFPEGWDYIAANQFEWEVGTFNTGFARIAMQTGAPVVPVAMQGLAEHRGKQAFPPWMRKIFDYPVEMQYIEDRCLYNKLNIHVGRPIPIPAGADPSNRESVKEFTALVNERVKQLYQELPTVVGFENVKPQPAGPPPPKPVDPALLNDEELRDASLE